jgi:hypothetical protein
MQILQKIIALAVSVSFFSTGALAETRVDEALKLSELGRSRFCLI